jgi:hypothetical protein
MASNVTNQIAFLRTSRNYSDDLDKLIPELSKTYIDVANAVNSRTIGLFSVNVPSITGESWFINQNQRQQSLRQVYTFTTFAPITHNIPPMNIERFVRGFGSYTDVLGNWYGLIFATNVPITGEVLFYITPTQIIFLSGGAPVPTKGSVVLEWLSQP